MQVRSILVAVILLLSGTAVHAQERVAAQTTFTVQQNQYLWDVWTNPVHRSQFGWTEFWHTVCDLNDLPQDLDVFRTMQAGRTLRVPVAVIEESVEGGAKERVDSLTTRIESLEEELKEAQKQRAETRNELREEQGFHWLFWALLIGFIGALLALGYLWRRREQEKTNRREVQQQLGSQRNELNAYRRAYQRPEEAMIAQAFIEQHAVRFDIPHDMRHKEGWSFIYLEKGERDEEGTWVRTESHRNEVKLKNLPHKLRKEEDLREELGIELREEQQEA